MQTSPMTETDRERSACAFMTCDNRPTHYVNRLGYWEAECDDHGSTAPQPRRFKEYGL